MSEFMGCGPGFVSAPPGEDPAPLSIRPVDDEGAGVMNPVLAEAMGDAYSHGVASWTPVINHRRIDVETKAGMADFVNHGKYASRQTFPTLPLIAGQLDAKGVLYRLTNVDGKRAQEHESIDTIPNPVRKDDHFTKDDVLDWIETATTWDQALGPVVASRKNQPTPRAAMLYGEHDYSYYNRYEPAEWL